jgi:hypothetical protein
VTPERHCTRRPGGKFEFLASQTLAASRGELDLAMDRTFAIAATVACNFTGCTAVRLGRPVDQDPGGVAYRFDEDDGQPVRLGDVAVSQFDWNS